MAWVESLIGRLDTLQRLNRVRNNNLISPGSAVVSTVIVWTPMSVCLVINWVTFEFYAGSTLNGRAFHLELHYNTLRCIRHQIYVLCKNVGSSSNCLQNVCPRTILFTLPASPWPKRTIMLEKIWRKCFARESYLSKIFASGSRKENILYSSVRFPFYLVVSVCFRLFAFWWQIDGWEVFLGTNGNDNKH